MEDRKSLIEKYEESPIRALIAAIPYVGGPIDILLSVKGVKWRHERIEKCIEYLTSSFEEQKKINADFENQLKNKVDTETFHDLFYNCLRESSLSRHQEKIKIFSNILYNYCIDEIKVDDNVDLIVSIVSDLTVKEFQLLKNVYENDGTIEYHFLENRELVDIYGLRDYYQKNKITYSLKTIPQKYIISKDIFFILDRLQNMLLIKHEDDVKRHYIGYLIKSNLESAAGQIPYAGRIIIQITDFGNNFIQWIKDAKE